MSAPKFGLDDAAVSRLAARLSPADTPVVSEVEPQLRFASFDQAMAGLVHNGFASVGSGLYKRAHSLWQLSKAGDGYSLVRVAGEPQVFEEDEVHEAPGMHSEEHLKMGARDRYGVAVTPGALVHYCLGGEPVSGRVVRAAYGYLDVRLPTQLDSGVPSDMCTVDRRVAAHGEDPSIDIVRDSPMHDSDKKDKEQMGMHVNPEKAASVITQHFGSYGATLADQVDQPLPRATVAKMNQLAQLSASCTCKGSGCGTCMGNRTRIASWESLRSMVQPEMIRGILKTIKTGMAARRMSKSANVPFALAFELHDDLLPIPPRDARALFDMAKGVRTASLEDSSYGDLVGKVGPEFASHVVAHVLAFRRKALRFQRVAVDQTAEDYWKAYFGDYGDQWVREIKRRVKADIAKAAMLKQGVDETAADYWSNYYGDYGEKLVDEVDRASKKDSVTATRKPLGADTLPMPLPQPVRKRDIFAGAQILADESWGNNRVALAKTASGGFQVLIRSGNAQKTMNPPTQREAISEFRKAVYAHCGG